MPKFLFVILLASVILPARVLASSGSQYKQSIVPLQCYIDAVNTGTGQHLYITPEDCRKAGVILPTPVSSTSTPLQTEEYTENQPNQPTKQLAQGPRSISHVSKPTTSVWSIFGLGSLGSFMIIMSLIMVIAMISRWAWSIFVGTKSRLP